MEQGIHGHACRPAETKDGCSSVVPWSEQDPAVESLSFHVTLHQCPAEEKVYVVGKCCQSEPALQVWRGAYSSLSMLAFSF